ncbi:T9SS type A sorting domain-containing protein [Luteibaculum oceani]|uniref:T9SS type A sorting domain-containing protein n=1 Tax=Luteibaculum oceani TaxID=1294296 RepID=A0A5C6VLP3_9FLAO|nr:T9SS type A sorting domain-containing protein [Luteibaculum oceani]TXC85396.1 T9SS type A sorting domain-containing protein [Luteibaculum oceani]
MRCLFFLIVFFLQLVCFAQTRLVWTGSASKEFLNPNNWNPSKVPNELDTLFVKLASDTIIVSQNIKVAKLDLLDGTLIFSADSIKASYLNVKNSIILGSAFAVEAEEIYFGLVNKPLEINQAVDLKGNKIKISGCHFKNPLVLTKTGDENDFNGGGNNFDQPLSINLLGNGGFTLGGSESDTFKSKVTLFVPNGANMQFAFKGNQTVFKDTLEIVRLNGGFKTGQGNGKSIFLPSAPIVFQTNAFESGDFWLKNTEIQSIQPLNVQATGSSKVIIERNSSFSGPVSIQATSARIDSSTFYKAFDLVKEGESSDVANGGNNFFGPASITTSGKGFYLTGNKYPDRFHKKLSCFSQDSGFILMAHASSNNEFFDTVEVKSAIAGGVRFGFKEGSSLFNSASTLLCDSSFFTGGTLSLKNVRFISDNTLNLSQSGEAVIHIEPGCYFKKEVGIKTWSVKVDSSIFQAPLKIEKLGNKADTWAGGNRINDSLKVHLKGKGSLFLGGTYPDSLLGPCSIILDTNSTIYFGHSSYNNYYSKPFNFSFIDKGSIRFGEGGGTSYFAEEFSISELNPSTQLSVLSFDSCHFNLPDTLYLDFARTNFSVEISGSQLNSPAVINAGKIIINGSTFHEAIRVQKIGSGFDNWFGGNNFNGLELVNNSSGFLTLSTKHPDVYQKHLKVHNKGIGAINLWQKDSAFFKACAVELRVFRGKIAGGLNTGKANFDEISTLYIYPQGVTETVTLDLNSINYLNQNPLVLDIPSSCVFKLDSSSIHCPLSIIGEDLYLDRTNFFQPVQIQKTGGSNNISEGGNTFFKTLVLENLSSANFSSGSQLPDIFLDSLHLLNRNYGAISMGYNSDTNKYYGPVIIESDTGAIIFGQESATNKFYNTIKIDTLKFRNTRLQLKNCIFEDDQKSLILDHKSRIILGPNTLFEDSISVIAGGINLEGTRFKGVAELTKTGTLSDAGRNQSVFEKEVYLDVISRGNLQLSFRDSGDVFLDKIYLRAQKGTIKFGSQGGKTLFNHRNPVLIDVAKPFRGEVIFGHCTFKSGFDFGLGQNNQQRVVFGPNATIKDTLFLKCGEIGTINSSFARPVHFQVTSNEYQISDGGSIFKDSTHFEHLGNNFWLTNSNTYEGPVLFTVHSANATLAAGNITTSNNIYFQNYSPGGFGIVTEQVTFQGDQNPKLVNLIDSIQPLKRLELNLTSGKVIVDGAFEVEKFLSLKSGVLSFTSIPIQLGPTANTSGGNQNAYIEQAVIKKGGLEFTLPLGAQGQYAPVGIIRNQNTGSRVEVSYFQNDFLDDFPNEQLPSKIDFLSRCGYWFISNPFNEIIAPIVYAPRDSNCYPLAAEEVTPIVYKEGKYYDLPNSQLIPSTEFYVSEADSAVQENFILLLGATNNFRPFAFPLLEFEIIQPTENVALLNFKTQFEKNNKLFEIQLNHNNSGFKPIGSIIAGPNPNQEQTYQFIDTLMGTGVYQYRIRQESIYGVSSYSPIRVLNLSGTGDYQFFPNPFTRSGARLEVLNNFEGEINFTLFDMYGKVYESTTFVKGENPLRLRVFENNDLKRGVYFVEVEAPFENRIIRVVRE